MRKSAFCICENKGADQLRGIHEADQCLCFRYTDSTNLLLPKSTFQASSHLLWLNSLVCVGPGQKPRRPVFSQGCLYDVCSSAQLLVAVKCSRNINNSRLTMLCIRRKTHTSEQKKTLDGYWMKIER